MMPVVVMAVPTIGATVLLVGPPACEVGVMAVALALARRLPVTPLSLDAAEARRGTVCTSIGLPVALGFERTPLPIISCLATALALRRDAIVEREPPLRDWSDIRIDGGGRGSEAGKYAMGIPKDASEAGNAPAGRVACMACPFQDKLILSAIGDPDRDGLLSSPLRRES